MWADLENGEYVENMEKDVIGYREKLVKEVNGVYDGGGCCGLGYGEIEYEFEREMFYREGV
ncbi:hypothetical protein [Staphylococcus auricularis]|uniref:hypothetical protein n=1 Tax=Staphylococcus auricularis TaxID=29379 RepID=UPI001246B33D|nr:hypothetical protein [Staphylococcus auricularis]